jgi:hypothetical protein
MQINCLFLEAERIKETGLILSRILKLEIPVMKKRSRKHLENIEILNIEITF